MRGLRARLGARAGGEARWDFTPEGPVYGPPGRQVPMQGHARFRSPMKVREEAEARAPAFTRERDWRKEE